MYNCIFNTQLSHQNNICLQCINFRRKCPGSWKSLLSYLVIDECSFGFVSHGVDMSEYADSKGIRSTDQVGILGDHLLIIPVKDILFLPWNASNVDTEMHQTSTVERLIPWYSYSTGSLPQLHAAGITMSGGYGQSVQAVAGKQWHTLLRFIEILCPLAAKCLQQNNLRYLGINLYMCKYKHAHKDREI